MSNLPGNMDIFPSRVDSVQNYYKNSIYTRADTVYMLKREQIDRELEADMFKNIQRTIEKRSGMEGFRSVRLYLLI